MCQFLDRIFQQDPGLDAIVWRGEAWRYDWLQERIRHWSSVLEKETSQGCVVSLESDFSPNAVALLLALIRRNCVIVPLTSASRKQAEEFLRIAEVETRIRLADSDEAEILQTGKTASHPLLMQLKERNHPGLVLFSSGSTGKSKAAVHDLTPMLEKYREPRRALRTIAFLLFDHIGGLNTLFHTLSNGGCLVTLSNRSPDAVCQAIERFHVQLLPTSPTFLNLVLLSEAYRHHDLSSLEVISYGTEVMPESTLRRICKIFPQVRMLQTYGLSELGIMRTKSRSSDSLWVRLGGEGFETRVANGMLEIRAQSAMLGYLNAPSPFSEDGWFRTGDAVEVDGDFVRILGRREEIINVGGEKVYPAEVEGVLLMLPGVEDVAVTGEANALTGQLVKARFKLQAPEDPHLFRKRMHEFCRDRLARYKIPQKVVFVDESFHGGRYKKIRREEPQAGNP